jgi:protein-disulfide isomerase
MEFQHQDHPVIARPTRLLLAIAAVLALAGCGGRGSEPTKDDMSLGKADAPIQLTEYASPTCPHCARFNQDVFPAFKAKYIDTGKVHYTLKEFLTPPVDVAAASWLVARCAGKDKYFTIIDTVFRSQQQMFAGTAPPRTTLLQIAQGAGMTEPQFNACVSDEAALKALNKRIDDSMKGEKVTGTPTFIVNGKQIGSGELTLKQLDDAIAEASKK